ncbi:MAG: hypothetical protein JWQ78_788 [Sediminibacterium sp.]|jgi:hypothetical protein|nr:hypothetical protein [Sediminibacterium sp.]
MSQTKVTLSPKELELVNDAGWILTKNAIIEKVYGLFGGVSEVYRGQLGLHPAISPEDIGTRAPKISKGEQYEGLPWVMLDYPRNFSGEDSFGIRSFFWWGNFCSITLQLSGRFQEKYAEQLEKYFQNPLHRKDWFIGLGNDPWKHHFRKDNYQPLTEWEGGFAQLPFIKLAKKISLHEWTRLDTFFEEGYRQLIGMLAGTVPQEA